MGGNYCRQRASGLGHRGLRDFKGGGGGFRALQGASSFLEDYFQKGSYYYAVRRRLRVGLSSCFSLMLKVILL